jgi:hypothetical protein
MHAHHHPANLQIDAFWAQPSSSIEFDALMMASCCRIADSTRAGWFWSPPVHAARSSARAARHRGKHKASPDAGTSFRRACLSALARTTLPAAIAAEAISPIFRATDAPRPPAS